MAEREMDKYDSATIAICIREYPVARQREALWNYYPQSNSHEFVTIDENYIAIAIGLTVNIK